MQSDAIQLVHCPHCLGSDVHLSRPHTAWDSVLLPAPIRCRSCATRFYKRVQPTELLTPTTLGRPHGFVPDVLPVAKTRAPAVLVVDDFIPFSTLIREAFARRGFAVFGAKSPDEGMALFQAHQPYIDLAVVGLVMPAAVNLDLTADLEYLRPGLPVLYLVGAGKTIARCSIEAQAPGSVLAVPFTEEQLIARVGGLLDVKLAARQRHGERLWEQLIAASNWMPSRTTTLHVYEFRQAGLASGHVAMLSASGIRHAFRPTNCEAAPYGLNVSAQDVPRARCLIGQVSAGRRMVPAA
jgi:DNA-binding response OmpR family regulator